MTNMRSRQSWFVFQKDSIWAIFQPCKSNRLSDYAIPLQTFLLANIITNSLISNLCLNKIVGTGIYVSPSVVLGATESKGISLMLWLVGCFVTWGG